jgi:hypothetical protein
LAKNLTNTLAKLRGVFIARLIHDQEPSELIISILLSKKIFANFIRLSRYPEGKPATNYIALKRKRLKDSGMGSLSHVDIICGSGIN